MKNTGLRTILLLMTLPLSCSFAKAENIGPQKGKNAFKEYSINYDGLVNRLDTLNSDISHKGILFYVPDNTTLLTGYSYHQVYDWDTYFECLYLSYYGVSNYCFNNVKSFLRNQKEDGFISRTINQSRPTQHYKPFLAQLSQLGSKQTKNYSWLLEKINGKTIFDRLDMSLEYWFTNMDNDKNGLPVWNSSDHSGMDNQISRSGYNDSFRYEGVDLACYIYREYKAMEEMANKLGLKDRSLIYKKKASTLAENVNKVFWDEKDGMYYDRDEKKGTPVKVKCVSSFITLWAGIAPKDRAKRLINEHLCNKNEFWGNYPICTYAKSERDFTPGYVPRAKNVCNWKGTTWIPTNYMVFHGLVDYGYNKIAKELADKTFDMVYNHNDITREFYNSETGEGLGLPRFWGWSSLAYIMPLELKLKYDPSNISSKIKPIVSKYLGIDFKRDEKNLYRIGGK